MEFSNKPFHESLNILFDSNPRISLNEIARRAQTDPAYVWRLRRGDKTNPSMTTIELIAGAFDVDPSYFLEYRSQVVAEFALRWPKLAEQGLTPDKALRILKLDERKRTDKNIKTVYEAMKWMILAEGKHPHEIDDMHHIDLYKRHNTIKGPDLYSNTNIKGRVQSENNKDSFGIKLALTGGSNKPFDSLGLKVTDNKLSVDLMPTLIYEEEQRKFMFVPFSSPLKNKAEFDISVEFAWEGTFFLKTDFMTLDLSKFNRGVDRVEQVLTFEKNKSIVLSTFEVDTIQVTANLVTETFGPTDLQETEGGQSFLWVREPFDMKKRFIFMFNGHLNS